MKIWKRQSELSLALFAMFASGGVFALLVVTLLPPERPVVWYVSASVSGTVFLIAIVVLIIGQRLTVNYAAWISSVYLLLLILLEFKASNLSRATVTGLLLVVVITFFAWFMPMWYTRVIGYSALVFIGGITVIRFPTNDGILTVIALVSLAVLLTEVFGGFKRNLQRVSLTDHLTGVWNRAGIERLLEAQMRAHRRTGEHLSVVYLDLDGFKGVNDSQGHHSGDEMLRRIAAGFTDSVRASDAVARVGGDEFMLLLPNTDLAQARRLCERLQRMVEGCGWSYGIAECRADDTLQQFVSRADDELVRAKQLNPNRRSG